MQEWIDNMAAFWICEWTVIDPILSTVAYQTATEIELPELGFSDLWNPYRLDSEGLAVVWKGN